MRSALALFQKARAGRFGGQEQIESAPDHLLSAVAKSLLGRTAEAEDPFVLIDGDECIGSVIQDPGKQGQPCAFMKG